MDERDATSFKPPYMSFQTFWNFINELSANPLPPQIDRSIMNSKSGTDQNNLILALKAFGLIDEELRVEPALSLLALADEDRRKAQLADLVRKHYPSAMEVASQNGTEKQLHDAFSEAFGLEGGDTRRKAVTFFLHAARTAGLELSPHFPKTRSGSGSPGTPRGKPKRRTGSTTPSAGGATGRSRRTSGDTYTVNLRSGEGTISVVVDVNLFELSPDDLQFVIGLVESLKGYDEAQKDGTGGAGS